MPIGYYATIRNKETHELISFDGFPGNSPFHEPAMSETSARQYILKGWKQLPPVELKNKKGTKLIIDIEPMGEVLYVK